MRALYCAARPRSRLATRWSASRLGRFTDRLLDGDDAVGPPVLIVLILLVGLLTWGSIVEPEWDPPAALIFPVILVGALLNQRRQLVLFAMVMGGLLADALLRRPVEVNVGTVAILVVLAATVLYTSRARTRLGLRGHRAESLLLELSEGLRPATAPGSGLAGWSATQALVPAGGARFSGDFVITCAPEYPGINMALVDVSGKGSKAAGRSLQLCGALRALLDAVPQDRFLESANEYVFLRDWDESFATAVQASVDTATGHFEVYNAGHHPAARWRNRERRWELLEPGGPALGLMPGEHYRPLEGKLEPGDALLLYSDGVIERPGQSLDRGVERLLNGAKRVLEQEWVLTAGAGERLVRAVAGDVGDDRAVVLLRRDPSASALAGSARADREPVVRSAFGIEAPRRSPAEPAVERDVEPAAEPAAGPARTAETVEIEVEVKAEVQAEAEVSKPPQHHSADAQAPADPLFDPSHSADTPHRPAGAPPAPPDRPPAAPHSARPPGAPRTVAHHQRG
jgi:hypothetical protein